MADAELLPLQAAEKYLHNGYGAKRASDWTVCGPTKTAATFFACHNSLIAVYDSTTGMVSVYQFDNGVKVG